MNRHYDTLLEEQRGPFTVVVDKTWEDLHPNDCARIDSCDLDWFMLRVRVLFEGHELAAEHVGGFLYEDAREVLRDGTAEDMIESALDQARTAAAELFHKLQRLDEVMG
jgi:urate oxidase